MKKIVIIGVIFTIIFLFFYYKNKKLGNNIIKLSNEKNIENILRKELNYKAEVNVKVYSNKNENLYKLIIEEMNRNSSIEAVDNKNISGLRIEKKNNDLIIKNSKLKLNKIYENYKEIMDNSLLLNNFIKEYNETNKKKILEESDEIIVSMTITKNRYIIYKELYVDKITKIPKKLIEKDSNKQVRISIEYINIEIF